MVIVYIEFNHYESSFSIIVAICLWLNGPNAGIDNYDGGSFGTEQNLENKRPIIINFIQMMLNLELSYNVSGHIEWLNLFGGEVI